MQSSGPSTVVKQTSMSPQCAARKPPSADGQPRDVGLGNSSGLLCGTASSFSLSGPNGIRRYGVTPIRARAAEALLAGQRVGADLLRAAGESVKGAVDPLSDHRGSAAYKREMAAVMAGRALAQAWDAARASVRGTR